MIFFRYRITLFDPLYYAREGLFGAFTPHVLHGTAVNHAITAALGLHPERQPYVIAESNGGMDVPRYADSRASHHFYFTPAAVEDRRGDWTEVTKGDNEGYPVPREGRRDPQSDPTPFLAAGDPVHGSGPGRDERPPFPSGYAWGRSAGWRGWRWMPPSPSRR